MQLEWLRQHRNFTCGVPRRHCIANIIKALDTEALLSALMAWINSRREAKGAAHIAIDGKVMRGSWKANVHKALNVVSAYDVDEGLALYQQMANSKGKEGELARNIIHMLTIKDSIVTLDALHCQRDTLNAIIDGEGDFVVQVKANQRALHQAVKAHFASHYDNFASTDEETQYTAGHGRRETRTVIQLPIVLSDETSKVASR